MSRENYKAGLIRSKNGEPNQEDQRIPEFIKYSCFKCLECDCESIFYYSDKCPDNITPLGKAYSTHSREWCNASITVGVILLTQIYRYLLSKTTSKEFAESYLVENMTNIEKLDEANPKDINLRNYLKDTFNNRKDDWVIKKSDNEMIDNVFPIKEDDLIDFYVNQFNECRKNYSISRRLSEIEVINLFNTQSYKLYFKPENPISIFYGSNGMGKTTIFRIIKTLFKYDERKSISDFTYLCNLPFRLMKITFADNSEIQVVKTENLGIIEIRYSRNNEPESENDEMKTIGECLFGSSKGDYSKGKTMMIDANASDFNETIKKHFQNIYNYFPSFKSDKRLLFIDTHRDTTIVDDLAFELKSLIRYINSEAVQVLKDNEIVKKRTYLNLLTSSETALQIIEDYKSFDLNSVAKEISKLLNNIRIKSEYFHDKEYPHELVYFKDTKNEVEYLSKNPRFIKFLKDIPMDDDIKIIEKNNKQAFLSMFDEEFSVKANNDYLASEIKELYVKYKKYEALNSAFKKLYNEYDPSKKELELNIKNGICRIEIVCSNGKVVDKSKLSSGELNILTILFKILFEAEHNSIILIDEPEISLHVTWVEQFADSILELIEDKDNIQIIMSSHSPFLAAGHNDFLTEGELLDNEMEITEDELPF